MGTQREALVISADQQQKTHTKNGLQKTTYVCNHKMVISAKNGRLVSLLLKAQGTSKLII